MFKFLFHKKSLKKVFPYMLWEIEAALQPYEVRLVGGTVRNYLLGKVSSETDIDMATTAKPEDVVKHLKIFGFSIIPTGIKHGTVMVARDGVTVEITTLRKDVSTDGRHADIEFTESWAEDSNRRDFTFNAIYMDLNGKIYDFHNGQKHLQEGKVKFIGEAKDRIQEDYLRILRYFRFSAKYSSASEMAEIAKEIQPFAEQLKTLSAERITSELLKMLMQPKVVVVATVMAQAQILTPIGLKPKAMKQLQEALDRWPEMPAMGRWYVLFGAGQRKYARLSRKQQNALREIAKAAKLNASPIAMASVTSRNATAIILAIRGDVKGLKKVLRATIPVFPIHGQDLMDKGIPEGAHIGKTLKILNIWWLEKGMPSRKVCLKRLDEMLKVGVVKKESKIKVRKIKEFK